MATQQDHGQPSPQHRRASVSGLGGYRMATAGDTAEIYLYGQIGQDFWGDGISAATFQADLKNLGPVKSITCRINSEGGSVFDGQAMYTLLTEHKAQITCCVDGLAASAASVVAMAGDQIRIAESAFVMVHQPWTFAIGNAADLRQQADLLDAIGGAIAGIYVARTGCTPAQAKAWMDAETWFNGADAVKNGFADVLVENMKVAASVRDPSRFRNLPLALRPRRAEALRLIADAR